MDNDTFNARVTTITLASVIEVVVLALLIGLFDPHVDNDKIFAILGPAFFSIVGYFVGKREKLK